MPSSTGHPLECLPTVESFRPGKNIQFSPSQSSDPHPSGWGHSPASLLRTCFAVCHRQHHPCKTTQNSRDELPLGHDVPGLAASPQHHSASNPPAAQRLCTHSKPCKATAWHHSDPRTCSPTNMTTLGRPLRKVCLASFSFWLSFSLGSPLSSRPHNKSKTAF